MSLSKRQQLAEVYAAYQKDAALAHLELRWNFVPGNGTTDPELVFIGEAPGRLEDELRRPFCGPSGRVYDNLLDSVGMCRDDVWTTNIVKYRPDETNRDPSSTELAASYPYLVRELAILRPRGSRIVTLGRVPLAGLGYPDAPRADWSRVRLGGLSYWLLPLYHPAVAIYQRGRLSQLEREFGRVLERPDADA